MTKTETETDPQYSLTINMSQPTSEPRFDIGQVLGGSYELRRIIGIGGMGHVYDAYDQGLNRRVAVKVGRSDRDSDVLVREARVMAAFRHPGLPTVHALGSHEGIGFVVMEYLQGRSLAQILRQERPSFGIEESRDVLLAIAESLAVLHGATLVHRDLKPANIMMVPPGRTVLCDFGVSDMAKFIPDGRIAGTPHYIAPEVALGKVSEGNAHLTDIYALGVLGFRLLTGRMPFSGSKLLEILDQVTNQSAPPVGSMRHGVPDEFGALIDDMISRFPAQRPSSVSHIVSRLKALDLRPASKRRARTANDAPSVRILVADDERSIWELMSYVLEDRGYEIVYVEDGEQALRELESDHFDIVVTDKNMPRLDGIQLLRAVRKTWPSTDVIVITGYPSKEAEQTALQSGAVRFIEKPFDIDDIADTVTRLAIRHRARMQSIQPD